MKKIIYLLVGIVLFGGLYYSCAPEELPGSIYGTVVDKATGEPIKSAGVELSPSGLKTVTGSEGQFEFTELDPGKYTLLITKTGYIDGVSHTIEVKPGQQAKGDVQIEKLPPALKVVNDNREEISILDFGSAEDDVARSFSLFNDGTETLEWELTATADWIKSVSKTTGTLSAGATQAIIITIDRAKLSSGENKTTVHITSNSGNKQLVVVAVNDYQATTLNVLPMTDIMSTSVTLHGEIVEDGSPKYTERGFVYAETHEPTIASTVQKVAVPYSDEKTFSASISELEQGKKYYVRAYAIQAEKELYSVNEESFTLAETVVPTVATSAITQITTNSAVAGGNVTDDGGSSVTERGVVYSTNQNPTVADNKIVSGSGLGDFICNLTNLQERTTYYVCAYAINSKGITYGTQVEFTTQDSNTPVIPPTDGAIVFDADVDQGNASFDLNSDTGYVISKNGITMTVSKGIIYTYYSEMHYRIYKNQTLTLSSTVGNIAKIEFICTHENNEKYGPGGFTVSSGYYTYNGFIGTWLGSTNEITFTAATNQVRATQVIVTLDKRAENSHAYVDLGLSVKWATCNVGATNPEDYGDYFAWGETQPKSTYDWSTYKLCNGSYFSLTKYCTYSGYGTIDNKTVLESVDDAAYKSWGGAWRMPTDAEWTELREQCTWTWTTQNGVNGYKVTSKKSGYTNNSIFLPAAGYRDGSLLSYAGSHGYYWSSSLYTIGPTSAWYMDFGSGNVSSEIGDRIRGRSVRPVCP